MIRGMLLVKIINRFEYIKKLYKGAVELRIVCSRLGKQAKNEIAWYLEGSIFNVLL